MCYESMFPSWGLGFRVISNTEPSSKPRVTVKPVPNHITLMYSVKRVKMVIFTLPLRRKL